MEMLEPIVLIVNSYFQNLYPTMKRESTIKGVDRGVGLIGRMELKFSTLIK
jgi:hypothetical protein